MLADVLSANRKLIEDVQYHVRKLTYDESNAEVWQEAGNRKVLKEEEAAEGSDYASDD